jgi:hypothetical protein
MVAREQWTRVRENADKLAFDNVRLHMSFREIGKAKALERSFKEEARAVEYKLSLDTNVELAPVFFEFPRVEAATVGGQAKIEAVVAIQVLRSHGPFAFGEIGRRAYDGNPKVGTDPNSYHILGDELAGADTCIDLLRHDVRETVVDDDLDVDVRVFRQNLP